MFILGIFNKDYESAGAGIPKNAPKKKGIALFFEIFLRKFWKILEVNLLYYLFFSPLLLSSTALAYIDNGVVAGIISIILFVAFMVLIGPASAGVAKIMRKYRLEKNSFIMHDFFSAFKENFLKASVIGFADILLALCTYAAVRVYPLMVEMAGSKLMYIPLIIVISFALIALMMNFYIFLLMVATDLSMKNLLKDSLYLAFLDLKATLITFVIVVGVVAALILLVPMAYLMIILPFFPFGFLAFVVAFNCYPVIQKYVINPYYTSQGLINPELETEPDDDEEPVFEDMGGKEKPIEKRKKGKGRRIS